MEKKFDNRVGESIKFESSKKLKLTYTPEMIEDVNKLKGFDYEAYNAEMKKHINEHEIEKLAFQIFLSKTGIRLKRELSPEEMKTITEVKEYEYYREEARKVYEKKLKSGLNKKYPVIEVDADGKSGMAGGAYCLCFVYSKHKGNFVVKGYMREVEEYLKKNYTHYFCNFSLWHLGANRDLWKFWKSNISISAPSRYKKGISKDSLRFNVRKYSNQNNYETELELSFKRMPKNWVRDFDKI